MEDPESQFLRMVRENEARLRRLCRIYAPDPDARQDLYQDILAQLWRSLPGFRAEAREGTWLYRVALNTALGFRRLTGRRRETALEEGHLQRPDGAPGPVERTHRAQSLERLYEAIARLPEADRGLVALYLDDVTYRDMAEILGISENHVGVRLNRIRKRLGRWLAEEAA